jgi:16S rRNA (guanine527-N7)-methyltransferase
MRVENIFGLKFDLITSRAVNQVETLLQISKHLSKKESQYLLFKGERVEDELRDLKLNYKIVEREKRKYLLILGQEGF